MDDGAAMALTRAASTVYAAARSHKRAEGAHRKQARALMLELARLLEECERRGVSIQIKDTDPQ